MRTIRVEGNTKPLTCYFFFTFILHFRIKNGLTVNQSIHCTKVENFKDMIPTKNNSYSPKQTRRMSIDMKNVIYLILIAIGSSTDNFTVGLTIGLKIENSFHYKILPDDKEKTKLEIESSENDSSNREKSGVWFKFNLIISICNAIGAWIAGKGGLYALRKLSLYLNSDNSIEMEDSSARNMASLLAGLAFGFLAMEEFKLYFNFGNCFDSKGDKKNSTSTSILDFKSAMQLAIPMTLNNLAGGIAGGTMGVSAEHSSVMAFIFSYFMMDAGYKIARTASNLNLLHSLDSNLIAGIIFSILASSQLWDYLS